MQRRQTQLFLLLTAYAVNACTSPAATPAPAPTTAGAPKTVDMATISVADLNSRPVVGELGVPLGTVVEVEATVVAGRELRVKGLSSLYLLEVTHVNGRSLTEPQMMEFAVPPWISASLANDNLDLHEMKTGQKAGSLDGDAIEELERGYVGKRVRVAVYEVGRFTGIPRNLPDDVPVWADVGFWFRSSLIVVAERK
jgi:hypothetical protein